jgi:hypothetical protein
VSASEAGSRRISTGATALGSRRARLVYYQPQVDDWQNFKDLDFRLTVSLTPAGGKAVVGVVNVHAQTDVSVDTRTV